MTDVDHVEHRLAAGRGDLVEDALAGRLAARGENHRRAFLGKAQRGGAADAFAGAGDDRDSAVEPAHDVPFV